MADNSSSQNKNQKIVVLLLVIGFIALTIIYWVLPANLTPRLSSYISLIAFLGTVLAIATFFINQQNLAAQTRQSNLAQALSFVQSNYLSRKQYFTANPDLTATLKRLYSNDTAIQALPNVAEKDETKLKIIYVYDLILQEIENLDALVQARGLTWDEPFLQPWIQEYRTNFLDPQLKERWNARQTQVTPSVRNLVNTRFIK